MRNDIISYLKDEIKARCESKNNFFVWAVGIISVQSWTMRCIYLTNTMLTQKL